jgi:hypothetical protein
MLERGQWPHEGGGPSTICFVENFQSLLGDMFFKCLGGLAKQHLQYRLAGRLLGSLLGLRAGNHAYRQ